MSRRKRRSCATPGRAPASSRSAMSWTVRSRPRSSPARPSRRVEHDAIARCRAVEGETELDAVALAFAGFLVIRHGGHDGAHERHGSWLSTGDFLAAPDGRQDYLVEIGGGAQRVHEHPV